MGLASSQARLLSITARLTSNEYESQQISNAKMRLAAKSQEASEEYIGALNDVQYSFVTFNSSGESQNTPLTAAFLYEYSDNKNQYILTNSAGKVLLNNKDLNNYEKSKNLDEFLECYGINKTFKTETLENLYNDLYDKDNGQIKYFVEWNKAVNDYNDYDENTWAAEKINTQNDYYSALNAYTTAVKNKKNGESVLDTEISAKQSNMEELKEKFTKLLSYFSAKESKIIELTETDTSTVSNEDKQKITKYKNLYDNYQKYNNTMSQYLDELENLGISAVNAYHYNDTTKAQWYTNLWYKINGPSTDKSGLNNYTSFVAKDGIREFKDANSIPENDAKILNSTVWISNALSKGLVSIEKASYSGDDMTLQENQNPFKFNLHGISWTGQIYSSISDIVENDNDKAISQAEAEYQRKTAEINAKDEKYQRKLSLLDSEHNAMQTEYESVKNAMNKNIDRSFKAFQG